MLALGLPWMTKNSASHGSTQLIDSSQRPTPMETRPLLTIGDHQIMMVIHDLAHQIRKPHKKIMKNGKCVLLLLPHSTPVT